MKVLKTMWQRLASLSLTLWLMIFSAAVMLFNSQLAEGRARLYYELNTTPLWSWLNQTRHSDPVVFVAVIILVASLAALALNTLACVVSRLAELSRVKVSDRGPARVFVTWAPTLMHVLFFLILAGHMATFSFGQWQHHTVRKGENLHFSQGFSPLTITSYSRIDREVQGPLSGSTISHRVELEVEGRNAIVRELQPLKLPNGDWLIFMPPQQKDRKDRIGVEVPVDCSGEERHAKAIPFEQDEPIKLKQVSDPGVFHLFIGFGLILFLMVFHYTISWRHKNIREEQG
jgi:hypothetical protein